MGLTGAHSAKSCSYTALTSVMRHRRAAIYNCTGSCEPSGGTECATECFKRGGLQSECGECMGDAFHCIYEVSPVQGKAGKCAASCSNLDPLSKHCEDCLMEECNPRFQKCAGLSLPIDYFFKFASVCTQDSISMMFEISGAEVVKCTGSCDPPGDAECAAECFKNGGLQRDCGECMGDVFHCLYEVSPVQGKAGKCAANCSGNALDPNCEDCIMGECNAGFFKCSGMTFPVDEFFNTTSAMTQSALFI